MTQPISYSKLVYKDIRTLHSSNALTPQDQSILLFIYPFKVKVLSASTSVWLLWRQGAWWISTGASNRGSQFSVQCCHIYGPLSGRSWCAASCITAQIPCPTRAAKPSSSQRPARATYRRRRRRGWAQASSSPA